MKQTFRNLIRSDFNQNSWGSLGIDIALGSKIDQIASVEEHLFLPKNLYQLLENATYQNRRFRLVSTSKTLNPSDAIATTTSFSSPLFILGILALLMLFITYNDYKNNKRSKWLDVSLFATTGVIGVVLLLLWFATDHPTTAYNYNLLWAFALNVLFIPSILKSKLNNRGLSYLKFLILLLVSNGIALDYRRSILCDWTYSASHCYLDSIFIFNSSFQQGNSCIIILYLQKQNFELPQRRKHIEVIRRTQSF